MAPSTRDILYCELRTTTARPRVDTIRAKSSCREYDALTQELRRHRPSYSIQHPSGGDVAGGYRRVGAARIIGGDEIEVVIRDDLDGAGEAVVRDVLLRSIHVRHVPHDVSTARYDRKSKMAPGFRAGSGEDHWHKLLVVRQKGAEQIADMVPRRQLNRTQQWASVKFEVVEPPAAGNDRFERDGAHVELREWGGRMSGGSCSSIGRADHLQQTFQWSVQPFASELDAPEGARVGTDARQVLAGAVQSLCDWCESVRSD